MKQFLTFMFCLLSFMAFTQSDFVDGSILKSNGETLNGQIDYREWLINPRSIKFKNTANKIETYTPNQITEFKIDKNNEIYKGAIVSYKKITKKWKN